MTAQPFEEANSKPKDLRLDNYEEGDEEEEEEEEDEGDSPVTPV